MKPDHCDNFGIRNSSLCDECQPDHRSMIVVLTIMENVVGHKQLHINL